jgi:hypothetical protein
MRRLAVIAIPLTVLLLPGGAARVAKATRLEQEQHSHAAAEQAAGAMGQHDHAGHQGHAPNAHLRLTEARPPGDADRRRAASIVSTLREAIEPYRDADRAQAEGYKPFLPHLNLPEYHFTNWQRGFLGAFSFDAARPTSLLYRRRDGRYELHGAMYTAPARMSESDLDRRVPLGIARWHMHVNICMPGPGSKPAPDWTKFGFAGSIATREACDAAGGVFHSQMFGWMVHVYPFETDPAAIWKH